MPELLNLAQTTVIKAANAFCMSLPDGRLPLTADHPIGLYVDDSRYLRGYELRIEGWSPRLLISSEALAFELEMAFDVDFRSMLRIESARADESEPTAHGATHPGGALAPGAAGV